MPGAAVHGHDLTTGSVPRHLLDLALPMLAGNLLNTGYSVIDSIWLGRIVGTYALGATAASFPVVFLFVALAGGVTMATTILVSQYYGAKRLGDVERVVGCSCVLGLTMGVVLAVAGVIASPAVLGLMRTPVEILPMATEYLRISFVGFVPMHFSFLISSILRGIGDTRTPLVFMAAGVALNAVLDPLLIAGFGPVPAMGLAGAAIASVLAAAFSAAVGLAYLVRRRSIVAPRRRALRFDPAVTALISRVGLPSAVQHSLLSLGMATITSVVNTFGATATAAFGVCGRIDSLAFMPAMSIGMAVAALTGQNLGAGRPDRVRAVFRWGMLMTLSITAAFSFVFVSLPRVLIGMFVKDPAVIAIGTVYLRIVGPGSMLFAAMFVSNGVINGSGRTIVTLAFSIMGLWGLRVPLAVALSRSPLGLTGIWIAFVVGFAAGLSASLIYYRTGRWKVPVTKVRPMEGPAAADAV